MKRSRNAAMIEIKNGNVSRTGIGDVSAASVGRNVDEVGMSIDADGGNNFILLGVDHADIRRPGVNHINFVSLGISRNSSRLVAHLQSSHRTKATQVNDGNRVALAVADVCKFAVERSVAGESALVKVVPAGGEEERDEDGDKKEFAQNAVPC